MKELIANKVKCLGCGETLVSKHRHDYVVCGCKNETMADGGTDYLRYGGKDMSLVQSLPVYSDEDFSVLRENIYRGGRGKEGDEPLKYAMLKDINDPWLCALIEYEETYRPENKFLPYYYKEQRYRNGEIV